MLISAKLCDRVKSIDELEKLEDLLVLGHLAHNSTAKQSLFLVSDVSELSSYFRDVAMDVAIVPELRDVLDQRANFFASFG